jgi:hypothetical protein
MTPFYGVNATDADTRKDGSALHRLAHEVTKPEVGMVQMAAEYHSCEVPFVSSVDKILRLIQTAVPW